MKALVYLSIKLPIYLTYMVQQVEYEPAKFLAWLRRRPDLSRVMYRQKLVGTRKAQALITFQYLAVLIYTVMAGYLAAAVNMFFIFAAILVPVVAMLSLIMAIYAGEIIMKPLNIIAIRKARHIFKNHTGLKVVILGSYGKTTMKELLYSVLSQSKTVAATPGNKNVPISHARWAASLTGSEEVLLIELGESSPGDIARFCRTIAPDLAVVTGIAPNHLDKYASLDELAVDLASVSDFLSSEKIYVDEAARKVFDHKKIDGSKLNKYGPQGSGKIRITDVMLSVQGMSFKASIPGNKRLSLKTGLIGRHLLGPLSVCISIALELGMTEPKLTRGVRETKPFEHRLQPREISGAWIIDDTYNGSLEGFRAGLALLSELKAKRKIYVTPGLVDQGEETENVHKEIGKLIAQSNPHKVVLIENSVTGFIKNSLSANGYKGEIDIREDALEFYTNLDHILAAGDLVMLQNDWTDNYS